MSTLEAMRLPRPAQWRARDLPNRPANETASLRSGRARGFTLIEILVVLVIVGVLALAVTLGIASAGGERQLTREAERFQALVGYACARAELTGREIGVRVDGDGYAFTTLGLDGWMAEEQQGELRARDWVHGLAVDLLRDGHELRFADADDSLPQIVCFSSGELSPFVLRLRLGDVAARYELSGRSDGRVELRTVVQR